MGTNHACIFDVALGATTGIMGGGTGPSGSSAVGPTWSPPSQGPVKTTKSCSDLFQTFSLYGGRLSH